MSSVRIKTKYVTEDSYGNNVEHTIYAMHNNTVDVVTIFDEDGEPIMWIQDTVNNNILDAINRLFANYRDTDGNLVPGIQNMDDTDRGICGI